MAFATSWAFSSETASKEGMSSASGAAPGRPARGPGRFCSAGPRRAARDPAAALELLAVRAAESHEARGRAHVLVEGVALLVGGDHALAGDVGHRGSELLERRTEELGDQLLGRPPREHLDRKSVV